MELLSHAQFFFLVVTTVILFLYGLENFSREVHLHGVTKLQSLLGRLTRNPLSGCLLGAGVTALIQSSSAVSALTIALVNSQVLTFQQSLGLVLGMNIGTTVTAQLVALKLTGIGPFFIVLGFLASLMKFKYSVIGKSLFYFGFIFFSLDLISNALLPLRTDDRVIALLARSTHPLVGVAIGMAVTALVQSSSVTTGLAILLAQQGNLPVQPAIAIILGANIGTTFTGLLACLKMGRIAKRTAVANFLINLIGTALFLLFFDAFAKAARGSAETPDRIIANAHLFFNLGITLLFLPILKPLSRLVEKIVPDARTDRA